MELFPKTMIESSAPLTPERVYATLISLEIEAHTLHLNTTSYAEHKALDELYSGIHDFRDRIMENILGHLAMNSTRLNPSKAISVKTGRRGSEVCRELCDFSYSLCEWAESNDWGDLKNIADELQAVGTKVSYLLTLS